MLQQSKQEKDIQRSLDRLAIVSRQSKATLSIPAFFYSANLLNKYAQSQGADNVKPHLFQTFKYLIQQFGKLDFSSIVSYKQQQGRNQQEIMNEILEIVDSQLFIDCLRPDIKSQRHSYEHEEEETGNVVLARERYNFSLPPLRLKQKFQSSPTKSYKSISGSQNNINQFDQIWQSIETAYREHNIDQAYERSLQYIKKVTQKTTLPSNRKSIIDKIAEQYIAMTNFYGQFDKGQWQFDKQQKGISLQYKVYEQQKMVAIRITGEFNIPLQTFLSVVSEIDLMGQYVPFCYDCKELRVLSRNQRIGTSKIYIPLLTDRQTYFYAVGYDRQKKTGGIFLYSKTINEDLSFQQKNSFQVPKQSKFVRLEYKFFIVQYIPITKQRAKIRLASKIDMKMNFLPMFILNKSARIFAFDYFKNILKIAKTYQGSAWEKKVAERPDLYDFFKKKVEAYFQTKYV